MGREREIKHGGFQRYEVGDLEVEDFTAAVEDMQRYTLHTCLDIGDGCPLDREAVGQPLLRLVQSATPFPESLPDVRIQLGFVDSHNTSVP